MSSKEVFFMKYSQYYIGSGQIIPIFYPFYNTYLNKINDGYTEVKTCPTWTNELSYSDVGLFLNHDYNLAAFQFGNRVSQYFSSHNVCVIPDYSSKYYAWTVQKEMGNKTHNTGVTEIYDQKWKLDRMCVTPKTRIIMVCSIGSNNNKEEICLSITEALKNSGRKVGVVFPDYLYLFIGCHFIKYENLFKNSVEDAINAIKGYIRYLSQTYKYDDLIICSPGDAVKYNEEILNTSGLYTFAISQALDPSIMICCVPFSLHEIDYYEILGNYLHEKYGSDEILFHMSNYIIDPKKTIRNHSICGVHIDRTEYKKAMKSLKRLENIVFDFRDLSDVNSALLD